MMTTDNRNTIDEISLKTIGRGYLRDVVGLLSRPGSFFEALPHEGHRRETLLFLAVTAVVYGVLATLFTPDLRATFIWLYLMNALLMPLVTAMALHLLLRFFYPGRYTYAVLLAVAAYANVVLLLGWVPGMAPWAEILKWVLIGLGLVKTGGIGGWKAFGVIAATVLLLVMMVYCIQFLMRF